MPPPSPRYVPNLPDDDVDFDTDDDNDESEQMASPPRNAPFYGITPLASCVENVRQQPRQQPPQPPPQPPPPQPRQKK